MCAHLYPRCRYYTFQFHMRELLEAMRDMLDAQAALLVRMPSNASHMNN